MKFSFSTVALFTSFAATILGAPTTVKRQESSSPLGGATSILDVLGPANDNITGLLSQLTPSAGGSPVDTSTVNGVLSQVTGELNGLASNLGLLNGLGLDSLLGGASKETVAQKVSGLANEVTGALSNVEDVIAQAAPELKGPINDVKCVAYFTSFRLVY